MIDRTIPRIAVVDDDAATCAMLSYLLSDEGFAVEAYHGMEDAVGAIRTNPLDLLVLDVGIGSDDGLALYARLRSLPACPPVVFLSGRNDRTTRLRAFELGALDYMTKPIDVVELVARVRVALRRGGRGVAPQPVTAHGLVLDRGRCLATRPDRTTVRLTPRETRLLEVLLERTGEIVGREEILTEVWGADFDGTDDVVEVYMGRLRRKLEGACAIHTIRGMGYSLDATPRAVPA